MRAMVLTALRHPLVEQERPDPVPGPGEIRIRVEACGVCRTDLHVVDGELPDPKVPIVPGHEIVGRVEALGPGVSARLRPVRSRAMARRPQSVLGQSLRARGVPPGAVMKDALTNSCVYAARRTDIRRDSRVRHP